MAKSLGRYIPELLVLKITLQDSDPKIWRRVAVDSGLTLYELHYVIQTVFPWNDSHLYQFHVPPGGKLTRQAMIAAKRYHTHPPDPFFDDWDNAENADEVMIGRIFTDDCKQIIYEYDFGDSWHHLVKLEKRTPNPTPNQPPVCLNGQNAAPPDDCGGIYGYYRWLAALQDSSDENHDDALEWFPEDFDPTAFDPDAATKELAILFQSPPKRPRKGK